MTAEPFQFSSGDFYLGDSDNPLIPPQDFTAWRKAVDWAINLYEPKLHGAAMPRVEIEFEGELRKVINFTSYNYLGLNKHPATVAAAQAALLECGTGACGSPVLCGMTDLHAKFEQELSRFLGTESTVVFTSGYIAAVATLAALLRRGDVAIADSKMHMSAVEGVRLAGAKFVPFEHNDPRSLAQCLDQHKGKRRLVLLEGLYSMEGDMPLLPELLDVAEAHGVPVFLDEAHSILTCGARGRGTAEHFRVSPRIALKYTSLSKACAALGGAVSGPSQTMDYVRMYGN